MITSFWKKISIQYCDRVDIRIDLEDAMFRVAWRTVNDATRRSYGTFIALDFLIREVRSNVSRGFVDGVEFHNVTSIPRNATVNGAGQNSYLLVSIYYSLLVASSSSPTGVTITMCSFANRDGIVRRKEWDNYLLGMMGSFAATQNFSLRLATSFGREKRGKGESSERRRKGEN